MPRRDRHHGGAVPARAGRPGSGRAVQRARQVLRGLFGRHRRTTTTCASRTSRSTASTRRPRTPAPSSRCRRCARAAAGRIGSVAPRFHGAPTNRSQRTTLAVDGPEIVARCQADAVDAAILVPNCPVCHQTVSLVARLLEENGIATVVMGCAKDIVEHVGVPRLLFSDFPLGNARRAAERSGVAGGDARARAGAARGGARGRARPCSRRCAGARAPTGSSTTATSSG